MVFLQTESHFVYNFACRLCPVRCRHEVWSSQGSLNNFCNERQIYWHYKMSVVLTCFLMPTFVPWYFWGESLMVSYFVPSLLRYTMVLNATWLVNSAAHMWGNRPYDHHINPRENKFVALSALGEGYHNYHHTFPFDYATSEFGCRVNLTTAFINLMCTLGLASDPKQVSKDLIHARVQRTGDGSHRG